MSFAISAVPPSLNFGTIDPFKPHTEKVGNQDVPVGHTSDVAGYDWCGTKVPRFPIPLPPKGGDDGWCGTVPHKFPFPVPPVPPQPWQDLGAAAQSFR